MTHCRHPLHCIIPPYVVDHMASSKDAKIRKLAQEVLADASAARAMRSTLATLPMMSAIPSPAAKKHRLIYDLGGSGMWDLPGKLVRSEGDKAVKDPAANEAYQFALCLRFLQDDLQSELAR